MVTFENVIIFYVLLDHGEGCIHDGVLDGFFGFSLLFFCGLFFSVSFSKCILKLEGNYCANKMANISLSTNNFIW
jgi:hypothetical protein